MELAAQDLDERGRWLVRLRWVACLGVLAVVWFASSPLALARDPLPLYGVALGIAAYNLLFHGLYRFRPARRSRSFGARRLLVQFALDVVALTLLLYFSDIAHNPFILYFAFHVVLASILLPGWTPYLLTLLAVCLVGGTLFLQLWGVLPRHALAFEPGTTAQPVDPLYAIGLLLALGSTLGIAAYLTTSVSRYVERVQHHMRQQQKMLGIGQLMAGFAHQIANPLDGLQNALRRIETEVRGSARLEETVHQMSGALDRIENVAKRLQEFARPQGLELQACEVGPLVDATLQLFGKTLEDHGIDVEAECAAVPHVWGDPYSIEEILFNLCRNAMDAMPQGGALRIRTYTQQRRDFGPDACVTIEVQDTGVGIPPDRLDKVFEPFYTTKSQLGGTGLGLGLCRMLLSEMGGTIEVESTPRRGSTFRLLLAAAPDGKPRFE